MTFKKSLCLLLIVLLTGCAGDRTEKIKQPALDFRTALMNAGGCSFTAKTTVDLDGRVYAFTLDCTYDLHNGATLTVTHPEEIAGVSAQVSQDGASLTYDGATLELGLLANGHVAPLAVGWLLGDCWTQSYISAVGKDGDAERITYLHGYHEKELTLDTWLSADGVPFRSELTYDGARCMTVELTDFQYQN